MLLSKNAASIEIDAIYKEGLKPTEYLNFKCAQEKKMAITDPDKSHSENLIVETIRGMSDVVLHDGKTTNREANYGIISYMEESLLTNDNFFKAAYLFLKKLQGIDTEMMGSLFCEKINTQSKIDTLSWALEAANGNQYLALKVLALFGHDNTANSLRTYKYSENDSAKCRFTVLNKLIPLSFSNLYCHNSIKGMQYSKEKIDQALKIAQNCSKDFLLSEEKDLCNDNQNDYQSDFYHVITSSFLGCRRSIKEKNTKNSHLLTKSVAKISDYAYLQLVKHYKIERFKEEILKLEKKCSEQIQKQNNDCKSLKETLEIVKMGLEKMELNNVSVLPSQIEISFQNFLISGIPFKKRTYNQRSYKAAQAILERYQFEINFRMAQHKMGLDFSRNFCKDTQEIPVCL